MKFFSFSKEDIYPPPSQKIIKKDDFSSLIEISQILEKAKEEAALIKEKTLKDCEALKEEATKEGFDEGLDRLNEHILHLDSAIEKLSAEYEKKILPIALKAAKKIVSEELKLHPERIVEIVKMSLKPVVQHHTIKIYVNKSDYNILKEEKQKILDILNQVKTFAIEERDDIETGGCIIETEGGIINAQLETQFRAIESAFEKFQKK